MSLNLKNEEESETVNANQVTNEITDPVTEENNSVQESAPVISEEIVNITPEPVKLENTIESRAAKRLERLAEFRAESLRKEKEIEENELRFKLKLLTEEQKNAFLKEKEDKERKDKIAKAKELFKQKRIESLEEINTRKEKQLAIGLEYQKNVLLNRAERQEKERIQKEAEMEAAASIRLAEESKRAADIVNAEAKRFADEARRRTAFAASKAKENSKKTPLNPPDGNI